MSEDFRAAWRNFYPKTEPLGYLMRESGTGHWVRFHSLPQSKRYAENDVERKTIVDRANAPATEILGHGSPCWLIQVGVLDPRWDATAFRARDDYNLVFAYAFHDDGIDRNVYARLRTWTSGKFDRLITSLADDEAASALWMSASDGAVFAPYGGGADVFIPSEAEATRLKAMFPDWLSPRSDGL